MRNLFVLLFSAKKALQASSGLDRRSTAAAQKKTTPPTAFQGSRRGREETGRYWCGKGLRSQENTFGSVSEMCSFNHSCGTVVLPLTVTRVMFGAVVNSL